MAIQAKHVKTLVFEVRSASDGARGAARGAPRTIDTDVIVVLQDNAKKAIVPRTIYAQTIEKLRKTEVFTARSGSVQWVRLGGKAQADNVLFVGLGSATELTEERVRQAGAQAWAKLLAEKSKGAAISVDALLGIRGMSAQLTAPRLIKAFAEGFALSAYQFDKHKSSDKNPTPPGRILFVTGNPSLKAQIERELEAVRAIAAAVHVTRDWSNEPSNFGTPEYFADEAKKLARQYGLKCTILGEREAKRQKMGLFLGVGQGAERESKIVILEYQPSKAVNARGAKTIAFVGKGVTFDSGGISIKPSARMEEMKHDMTGAATVMGATLLAAALKVRNRIVTVMAFTENMPDGKAIQPGNVLTSRSGKTVEIINTDAEGRLVLADVLDFVQDFKPDVVIDAATLTGAVGIALGKQCCAVLGNDDALIDSVRRAGDACGEKLWQLPLFDEYFEDMKSDTADMKNSCNDAYGGVIRGAIFLKQFIKKGLPWAHLDIAAMAANVPHFPYFPRRGATGAYVRTLAQFAADF
ncbi:leucyl aminopeptidase [Bdellovibrionota bacterium FG-1]